MTVNRRLNLNPNRKRFSKRCDFGGDRIHIDLALPAASRLWAGPLSPSTRR
jgi:hypothetical protein